MKRLIKSVKNVLFLWQKKRQQRKALVEELLEKAYEAVQRMENDPSDGYIDIEKMLSTVKAYEPLRKAIFRTKGMRCYAVIQRFLDAYDRIEDTGQRVNRRYIESEAKKAGTLGMLLKKLYKASVVILDEFGYVPYDRTGAQLLFDFLSEIHEQKSVILNTNLEFSRWVNVLYDEQMTAALVGRLIISFELSLLLR
jgi:hypothetical protein